MRHGKVVLVGGDRAHDEAVRAEAAAGELVRVGDGVYVDAHASFDEAVCGAYAPILAKFAPGAVLFGVSGVRGGPLRGVGEDGRPVFPGWLFATHATGSARKRLSLPGLEIRSTPGPGPLEGDVPFLGIHLPSPARQMLENLRVSRALDGPARTLGREGVEHLAERILRQNGPEALREILHAARRIAPALGAQRELGTVEEIVAGLTAERDVEFASFEVAARNRRIDPYDPDCLDRLKAIVIGLAAASASDRPDPHVGRDRRECASFIEAYFSNYIEGTKFLVDKARRIVFEDEDPDGRPKDGRDVVQTYRQIAALRRESVGFDRDCTPVSSFAEFLDELRGRHARLMDARPEVNPGRFKADPNRAGNHVFVMPDLVVGTLREGFAMLQGLQAPFARALFVHALCVLVHPFEDGNGRASRILMTKELVTGGQSRIVVPTIFRNDYIGAMRALTRPEGADPRPYVRALVRCQEVSAAIAEPDLHETIRQWAATNAFLEDERSARLLDPDPRREVEWRDGLPAAQRYWEEIDAMARAAEDASAIGVFGR